MDDTPSPHSRWNFVARRAQVLTGVSALLTIAGSLGNFHWFLELFSHFVAWYALGTAVLALLLGLCRSPRWALAAGALCLLQASIPLSWYWPQRNSTNTEPNCRLLLANVLSSNPDTARFFDLVTRTNPDIICVQEVSAHWEEALSVLERDYPVHLSLPRSDNFGIAIYSRLPGPQPEILFQENFGVPALALQFEMAGQTIRLLNLHALPPAGEAYAGVRNAQLDAAKAWLVDQESPAVLIGDLNTSIFSPRYRRLVEGTGARNARAGFGPLGTWPAWVPILRLPLDQCLVKGPMSVVRCATGRAGGSDHLPLMVDLRLSAS